MPVINRNTPVANIAVPIPQPIQTKPKQSATSVPPAVQQAQRPRPQHRPLSFGGENDQFGRRVQGVSAVILPWSPQPKRMSRGKPKRYSGFTTEEDFHRMLDENPNDHHTRMIFADWLQDRDDPRAEGYRALGQLQKLPEHYKDQTQYDDVRYPESWYWGTSKNPHVPYTGRPHMLPHEWFSITPQNHPQYNDEKFWKHHTSRRGADDAAALAFGQLPEERKAQILQPKKLSRKRVVVSGVRRYGRDSNDLVSLLRQARQNPYENITHGLIADALDEAHPGNKIAELIREQFGHGEHGGKGEKNNLWHEGFDNSYDGTHPYMTRLGTHGPFNLYLGHESPPDINDNNGASPNARWVLRAMSRLPGSKDVGYNFEFPHEEAHRIPQMFPSAEKHIIPHTGKVRTNRPAFPGAKTTMPREWTNQEWRQEEANQFDQKMDAEEAARG